MFVIIALMNWKFSKQINENEKKKISKKKLKPLNTILNNLKSIASNNNKNFIKINNNCN